MAVALAAITWLAPAASALEKADQKTANQKTANQITAKDWKDRGDFLFFHGDREEAVRVYQEALKLKPDYKEAQMTLLNLYMQQSNFESAIKLARSILEREPKNKELHLVLGNLLRTQKRFDESINELKLAAQLGAREHLVKQGLGYAYLQKGELEEADRHLRDSARKTDSADTKLALAIINFRKGRKEEALNEIDGAIKERKDFTEAHGLKGDILSSLDRQEEAASAYQTAINLRTKSASAYTYMAARALKAGDQAKAQTYLESALLNKPDDTAVKSALAFLASRQEEKLKETDGVTFFGFAYKDLLK